MDKDFREMLAASKNVVEGVQMLMNQFASEVKGLAMAGGGALRNELEELAGRMRAMATDCGVMVAEGTSADKDAQAAMKEQKTSDEVLAEQKKAAKNEGAAGKAAESLKGQDKKVPA